MNAAIRNGVLGAAAALAIALPIALRVRAGLFREIGLERDRAEALGDTTRELRLSNRVLAGDRDAFQRRIVQEQQRADSIDRALKLERKAKVSSTVQVAQLDTAGAAAQHAGDGVDVRVIDLDIRPDTTRPSRQPFTLRGTITSYPLPQPARFDLRLGLEPIHLTARISCGVPARANNNVRPALFTVEAPAWARISIDQASQDPAICNQTSTSWMADWKTWTLAAIAIAAGLSR